MTFATQIDKQQVQALLEALEQDDQSQASHLLDELTKIREGELHQQLRVLTQNLHQTLDDLDLDTPILLHAKHDLPDITERLRYVIDETQTASEKTLGSAENALSFLEQLEPILSEGMSEECCKLSQPLIEQCNSELTNIMLAQSYQDLTGQVLNRVILIVTALEESLKELIQRSKHEFHAIPDKKEDETQRKQQEAHGVGPNVTTKSKQDAVESQDDVDDLLDGLGI